MESDGQQDPLDPFPDLPQTINIGGEIYSFNRSRILPVNLHIRTYEEFLQNYNLKSKAKPIREDAEQLVRAYLPYGATLDLMTYTDMPEDDRKELMELLDARVKKLSEAVKMKKNAGQFYVRNYKDVVSSEGIKQVLDFFSKLREQRNTTPTGLLSMPTLPEIPGYKIVKIQTPTTAAKTKKRLAAMSDDEKTEQILRMAFYTLHPDKLDRTILTEWENIQDWARKAGPSDFIKEIRQAAAEARTKAELETKETPQPLPAKPLDWLSRMNYAKLQESQDQDAAKSAVKSSLIRLESEEEMKRTRAINSLRRILMVLAQKKYLSEENAKKAGATNGEFTTEMEKKLQQTLQTRLYVSLQPLFDTFEEMYSDYYTSLVEFLRSRVDELNSQEGLLNKFQILYNFLEEVQGRAGEEEYPIQPGGLYRLTSPPFDPDFKAFLAELFQTLANLPTLPVKEMDTQLYYGLATKDLIGWQEQVIPKQTVMDRETMMDFLDQDQDEPQNPIYLFPASGGTGPTSTLYKVTYDQDPPQIDQKLVIIRPFRDLFAPNREKMITNEAARVIMLAMYQVILENRANSVEDVGQPKPAPTPIPIPTSAPAGETK